MIDRRLVRNMHMSDLRASTSDNQGGYHFNTSNIANSLDIHIQDEDGNDGEGDHEAAFRDDLRVASGIGRLKAKGKKRVSVLQLPCSMNLIIYREKDEQNPSSHQK